MQERKKPFLKGFSTVANHQYDFIDKERAHLTPIYASSTYFYDNAEDGRALFAGEKSGFLYGRFGNPTNASVEAVIANLEGLQANADGTNMPLKALLHASGMAAIYTALISNVKQGESILTHHALYGGTNVLMDTLLPDLGIKTIVDSCLDMNKVEQILKQDKSIKVIYIETPTNPTIQCIDIAGLVALAKKYGQKTICDNTFNTPYIQQPFKYGVDFVVHSTTKFLNGHGTAIGGVLIGKDVEMMTKKIKKTFNLMGACASPFDAFLLSNGIKTLELRMEKHCSNAMQLATYLQQHKKVQKVHYLGFEDNANHIVAKKQMKAFGSMLAFEIDGAYEACLKLMNSLQLCTLAVSLGTCDTLICHPYSTTHLAVPEAKKIECGIKDNQLRVTIGIENIEDIIADFEQALSIL